MTSGVFDGAQAPSACDPGFHMASFWEIRELAGVEYDPTRGLSSIEGGEGPPALESVFTRGWVRTGTAAIGGMPNCNAWTTASSSVDGTTVRLPSSWSGTATQVDPWSVLTNSCNTLNQVWCLRD